MSAHAVKVAEIVCFLRIEKVINEYRQHVEELSNVAWYIAYTALWNTSSTASEQQEDALKHIRQFIAAGKSPGMAFKQLAERVLLARQYLNCHPGKWVPQPADWFNPENKNGFAGTERWLQSVEIHRATNPTFKLALQKFPEAIIQTLCADCPALYHDWRNFFITHNAQGLLNLYLAVLANYCFGEDEQ